MGLALLAKGPNLFPPYLQVMSLMIPTDPPCGSPLAIALGPRLVFRHLHADPGESVDRQ